MADRLSWMVLVNALIVLLTLPCFTVAAPFVRRHRWPWRKCTTPRSSEKATQNVTRPVATWKIHSLPVSLHHVSPLERLRFSKTTVYLLGTAHVSAESVTDVQVLLNAIRPDTILVELCEARTPLLLEQQQAEKNDTLIPNERFWPAIRRLQREQNSTFPQAACTVLLTSVQDDYADTLETDLGGEFRAAHEYWRNQSHGTATPCHLILGDRPVQLTLQRAWESLSVWGRFKVGIGLLLSCCFWRPSAEKMKEWLESVRRAESDVLTKSFEELKRHFPTLYQCIVTERDAWLAAKLVQTCQGLTASRSGKESVVVAIVGAGHVPGMIQWLTNKNTTLTPVEILTPLCQTRKYKGDTAVEKQMTPMWVNHLVEMTPEPVPNNS